MKANTRMAATLAVVVSLFVWAAAASPVHAQKKKKAAGANKAAQQADREAKKEQREAKKEERQAGKGAGKADREARKEEREAKKEERQAKKKEKQDARGDSAQPSDAANGDTAKKSRRANAAGQSGTDNLGGDDDPFDAKGKLKAKGKRAAKSQQTGANATAEGEAAPDATQDATTTAGEQPAAKGRRAKAKAAANASGASTEDTTTTGTPAQTPVSTSPSATTRNSVPSTSTGATSSSGGGDTPAASETPVEQPEATEPVAAGGSKDGSDQKFMKAARQDLNKALNALKRASADKGGHRERAVDLVGQAVAEIDKGMAYDKQNPNDRQRERPGKRSEQQPRGDEVDGAFGVRFVAASWAAQKPSEQPNMQMAKTHLQSALSNLDKATADKGGFRVNAVRLAREALKEVEQGIAYDNTHKDGN